MSADLVVRSLTHTIAGRRLLDGIEFQASAGEFIALCGPNGAGKSTLLRLISGELKPTGGDVLLNGTGIGAIPQRRLAAMRAFMQQHSSVAGLFSAYEVVRLGAEGIGVGLSSADRDAIAADAIAQADVGHLAARSIQVLSGGERQRIAYARALAQLAAGRTIERRQLLLLDEPTASLDLSHQLALLAHARSLAGNGGVLVIAVLHDLPLAHEYADRVLVLHQGRLAAVIEKPQRLPRTTIETVFGVSVPGETCPHTPWIGR